MGTSRVVSGEKTIDFDLICEAVDLFDNDESSESMTLLVSSKGLSELRKDSRFNDGGALSDQLTQSGSVGMIAGCKVVKWKKLTDDTAYILKNDALTIFIKRNVTLENQRDILSKCTTFSADEHYLVAIEDETKIVKLKYVI